LVCSGRSGKKSESYLKNLDWQILIDRMMGFATSELARQKISKLDALADSDEARISVDKIEEVSRLVKQGLRPHMESLDLFSTWFPRLEKSAVLKTLELKDVRFFCLETVALLEVLEDERSEFLKSIYDSLMPAAEPLSAIDLIITPSGDIRMDASETMFRLHQEKTGIARQLHTILDRAVKNHRLETLLQDKYVTTRDGRWVLPIRSGQQHHFPGIIHDSSQSKQTVFMEPQECVPLNNRLREIELEIEAEIERLLTELSHYLSSHAPAFKSTKEAMFEMDYRLAIASLCVKINAQKPKFNNDKLNLVDVRHPLLVLNGVDVIPNSASLDKTRRLLLLSGPNAGGKTVLLKAIGLAAQMARSGVPICANATSEIPFFKNIVVGVGDNQSVDANLSTFAAHLKLLDSALKVTSTQSLILIDEICGSTDPEEGAALARSFIMRYGENSVFGVITSHLGALKTGWTSESGIISGSLEFDKTVGPTYRFLEGIPGQSLAIQTAKRVGVDESIIEKAYQFLSPEVKRYQQSLAEVEKLKNDVWELQSKLRNEQKDLESEKQKLKNLQTDIEKERNKNLDKVIRESNVKIDELLNQAKAENVFNRHRLLQKIKYELPQVVKGEGHKPDVDDDETELPLTETSVFQSAEEFGQVFPPGKQVSIPHLNKEGTVQTLANAKGEVVVLTGSMRLSVHWRELARPMRSVNPTRDLIRKSRIVTTGISDDDAIVDVRGLTADSAISKLEIELDKAALRGDDRVKVVHGHGTDTLKKTIRSYLSRSVYVKKWVAGNKDTGGDGLTWIEIK
jgi:DNA mismatch repair protein MutS2